jgi:hypothetical protein
VIVCWKKRIDGPSIHRAGAVDAMACLDADLDNLRAAHD